MQIDFRQPTEKDLDRIMTIERSGFSPAEAASEIAMLERIQQIPDSFLVAINLEQEILGYVVGPVVSERYLSDELFEKTIPNPETGGFQTILSLAVAPEYYNLGIASCLLTGLAQISQEKKRAGITLTCLANLIPFYQKNHYQVEGVSESTHANEVWYNLVRDFSKEIV